MFGHDKAFNYEEIKQEISKTSKETAVYIGCDSKKFKRDNKNWAVFVTTVVLHFEQHAGAKVFRQVSTLQDYSSGKTSADKTAGLRMRLMHEVQQCIETALELREVIDTRPFQIHLDVNTNPRHKSSIIAKEAASYVMGSLGIKPHLKPDSWCATAVADRYTAKVKTSTIKRRTNYIPL